MKETKETGQLNVKCDPGQDPGPEKTIAIRRRRRGSRRRRAKRRRRKKRKREKGEGRRKWRRGGRRRRKGRRELQQQGKGTLLGHLAKFEEGMSVR